jgi:EmrB/QacA subfamily drug resistance transporter
MQVDDAIATGETEYGPSRWWTLSVLCLSLFMVVMGNTVLNIALPTIADELNASSTQLQWIVDAYSLVFAGLLFTAGSIGDRFGRKKALNVGLLIFGTGSAVATLAGSAGGLIACRAVMGLGAALVMPATLSILTHSFPPHERAKAIGIWAGVAGSAAAVGPIASGWLLEHFYWGSVFWLNVPVVIIALVAGHFFVHGSKHPDEVPLDPVGALLSIGTIVSLVYALIEAPNYGWTDAIILAAFGIAGVLLVAFIAWELSVEHPMLDVRLFKLGGFTGGSLAIGMMFFGMFGMFFLLTQYLQLVLGYSALQAGVRTLPFAATMMIAAPSSAGLSARFGSRTVVPLGMTVAGAGMLLLGATAGLDTPYWVLALCLVVLAGGMGMTMAPSTANIMSSVPFEKAGVGSAQNDTTRELGGALGIAVLGTIYASVYRHSMADVAATLPGDVGAAVGNSLSSAVRVIPQLGPQAPAVIHAARSAYVDGLGWALATGAIVAWTGAVLVRLVLPRRSPSGS